MRLKDLRFRKTAIVLYAASFICWAVLLLRLLLGHEPDVPKMPGFVIALLVTAAVIWSITLVIWLAVRRRGVAFKDVAALTMLGGGAAMFIVIQFLLFG